MGSIRSQKSKSIKHKSILAVAMVALVFLTYDLSGLGGNINFYASWIRCGQSPVLPGATIGGGPKYYEAAKVINPMRYFAGNYFCSPRDAELAGYSASDRVFSYPHLTDQEQRCLALIRNELPYDPSACTTIRVQK